MRSLGLVGESGSGKSTVAAAILRILARNGRITGGSILFEGRDLTALTTDQMRRVRGADIAMIFQDPLGSLNPTMAVGNQLIARRREPPGVRRSGPGDPHAGSSNCSVRSGSPMPRSASTTTPTSSPEACASGS